MPAWIHTKSGGGGAHGWLLIGSVGIVSVHVAAPPVCVSVQYGAVELQVMWSFKLLQTFYNIKYLI